MRVNRRYYSKKFIMKGAIKLLLCVMLFVNFLNAGYNASKRKHLSKELME